MHRLQLTLFAFLLGALSVIAWELHDVATALRPLGRLPVANDATYGESREAREQRIDRRAHNLLQTLDDDAAVSARVRELKAERAGQAAAPRAASR